MVRDQWVYHTVRPVTAQDNLLSSISVLRFALSTIDLGNAIVHSSCKLDWKKILRGRSGGVEWCVEIKTGR